jgi:small-conductance mechanosensitive channel
MNGRPQQQPWIPLARIEELVQFEPALVIVGLCVVTWLIYKIFLREVASHRHQNLQSLFVNLLYHAAGGTGLFALYYLLGRFGDRDQLMTARLMSYVGLFTILSGAIILVKVSRILAFEYLFLGHMRVAVPVLLVNLFTLLLSAVLGAWILSDIFGLRLAPLLATSAIFSLVVGLALQDTLGNLFAGVALQFDKPYEIGDWIEVSSGGVKWVGQVEEISWRATLLISFTEELITVPNRVVAQSEISNFTRKGKPIVRSQIFRIPFDTHHDKARAAMLEGALRCNLIRQDVPPLVLALETTDSWIMYKVIYFIDNFGNHPLIGDQVIRVVMESLTSAGIQTAAPRLQLQDRAACNKAA